MPNDDGVTTTLVRVGELYVIYTVFRSRTLTLHRVVTLPNKKLSRFLGRMAVRAPASDEDSEDEGVITFTPSSATRRKSSSPKKQLAIPPAKLKFSEAVFDSEDELVDYGFSDTSDEEEEDNPNHHTTSADLWHATVADLRKDGEGKVS